ncbi:GAF domain-containing protein [Sphingomonas sp. MMS24-JH45]
MSAVSILHGDYQYLIAASGLPLGVYSRRTSFCGHAIATGDALFCVPDLAADRRYAFNPWVTGESGDNRFYAAAVLRDEQGWALGALCVLDDTPRSGLSAEEETALATLADDVVARIGALRDGEDQRAANAAL